MAENVAFYERRPKVNDSVTAVQYDGSIESQAAIRALLGQVEKRFPGIDQPSAVKGYWVTYFPIGNRFNLEDRPSWYYGGVRSREIQVGEFVVRYDKRVDILSEADFTKTYRPSNG